MKRLIVALTLITLMLSTPAFAAEPVDEYDDSQAHPLRVIAYLVNPVGYALEWILFRPIHYVVAQPRFVKVFGHEPHTGYTYQDDVYWK